MDGDLSFGPWLKQRRKALDLTQHDLAQRVGCSAETIRKIEADRLRPSRQIAELLADENIQLPILHLGLPDAFQHHGSREQLLAEAGLDAAGIRDAVLKRWPEVLQAQAARMVIS